MNDIIKKSYENVSCTLTNNHANLLDSYVPKGCPFSGYTLLDLLKDLFYMYNWKITKKEISVIDFIKLLINDSNIYAVTYGPDMIRILES